jgi:hypothetical protein
VLWQLKTHLVSVGVAFIFATRIAHLLEVMVKNAAYLCVLLGKSLEFLPHHLSLGVRRCGYDSAIIICIKSAIS